MQTGEIQSELMRTDLQKSLIRNYIEPSVLSTFQRIILTTDGTLTEILEAYLFEQIQVIKIFEQVVLSSEDITSLSLTKNNKVLDRKILLQGKISRKNLIYAESVIVLNRLEDNFQDELLKSTRPIGRLWLEHKLETFKEIIDSGKEPANDLAYYFINTQPEDMLLFRTYLVFSNRQPIMMITEKFPESYFLKNF